MAHELTEREDGFVEMAFTGSRDAIWHGLGNELPEGAPIEDWQRSAGMDWQVLRAPVSFTVGEGINAMTLDFDGREVMYRSDSKAPLAVCSDKFQIVQPGEILEFFRDLVASNGMKLSTAGTLFGGRRFWALAEMGKDFAIDGVDKVKGNLLLTTSVDGSSATTGRFVSTRVVCNNTLTLAMAETGASRIVRRSHHSVFDPKAVKIDLGLIDKSWDKFLKEIKQLSETKMDDRQVRSFFEDLVFDPKKQPEEQTWGTVRRLNNLESLYRTGAGADMAYGTAWGALNAVTNMYTHGTGKRDPSAQFVDSFEGEYAKMKSRAMDELLALA